MIVPYNYGNTFLLTGQTAGPATNGIWSCMVCKTIIVGVPVKY